VFSRRRRTGYLAAVAGLAGVVALAGCAGPGPAISPPGPSGPAGIGVPAPQTGCTAKATDGPGLGRALSDASAGDVVCVTGDLGDTRLTITKGGSKRSPLRVIGDGRTRVAGITVAADNVVVDGFVAEAPRAPGASLKGSNVTLRNTVINGPRRDDGDGIRFWGSNITISHNTISDTRNRGGAHADCMQTFATDSDNPASQDVLIDSNRCEKIDNNCLIVEGPNSSAGDGSGEGETSNIIFSNNYCENKAAQAVLFDDARHAVLTGNEIAGDIDHAFALQNKATDAVIDANLVRSVRYEVGMDRSCRPGYQGPEPGGAP
jgi:hypothetical protein